MNVKIMKLLKFAEKWAIMYIAHVFSHLPVHTCSHFSVFSLRQVWSFILSFQLTCDHHMPGGY